MPFLTVTRNLGGQNLKGDDEMAAVATRWLTQGTSLDEQGVETFQLGAGSVWKSSGTAVQLNVNGSY
jgi:hypothetical protein